MSDELDSNDLVRAYVTTQDEAAFSQLVRRHVDLVFSAARRQLSGDTQAARDVTQAVFCDLATKAKDIPRDIPIAGWLYRHTSYLASNHSRSSRRRDQRERHAVLMQERQHPPELNWNELAPVLDEAMHSLSDDDRDALVLRFFENRKLREIGHALGASEEAARKRVDRALDKLRIELHSRGVVSTAAALATMVSGNAVMPAPPELAATISHSALPTMATYSAATSSLAYRWWLGLATTAVVIGTVAAYQTHLQGTARIQRLEAVNAQLSAELALAREQKSKPSAVLPDAVRAEIAGLRGEVARLRRQQAPANKSTGTPDGTKSTSEKPPVSPQIQIESKWILVPEELIQELDLARQLPSEIPTKISASHAQELLKAIQADPDAALLGAPKVTTLMERQAQVAVTDITTENGQRFINGPMLDVIPSKALDGAIDLEFLAVWKVHEPMPEAGKPLPIPRLEATQAMMKMHLQPDEFIALRRPIPEGAVEWAHRASPEPADAGANPSLIILISAQELDSAGHRIPNK